MNDLVNEEVRSKHHKLALTLFPIAIFMGYISPVIFFFGLLTFFLVTSYKLLKKMLFFMLILGLIALIPLLNIAVFIVMVYLFIRRINYVIQNWRPFVAGLATYGGAVVIAGRGHFAPIFGPGFNMVHFIEAVVIAMIGRYLIHHTLKGLYLYGYSSYVALGIMGSAPLIVISFILPFLKLHIGGDAVVHDGVFHSTGHHGSNTVVEGIHVKHTTSEVDNPVIVKAHVRTAPDGDVTNNLSYDGPDAKPPSTEDLVQVSSHVRTAPDGDVTNNLSYDAQNATPSKITDRYFGIAPILPSAKKITPKDRQKIEEIDKQWVNGQRVIDHLVTTERQKSSKESK
ncbi:hypothetical protein [Paenibacillus silvisoli]|uniref:hypothetical protein n=1 Tax=Paenibacillus silvisoli TaxID=3110539 RepID=UPI0028050352|nr:hypothetical protein [Paenibacillus silvisoli]